MKIDKDKILKKWGPILNKLGINNEKLCIIISLYCELYYLKNTWVYHDTSANIKRLTDPELARKSYHNNEVNNDLPYRLKEIKRKLDLMPKIKVVGYWYSKISNKIEYELEDGSIVGDNIFNEFELKEEQFIDLFGELALDVMKQLDIEEFRENRINDILTDE